MSSKRWYRKAVGLVVAGIAAVGVVPGAVPDSPSVSAGSGSELGAGGEFHAVTPERIFDSRGAGINDPAPGPKRTGVEVNVPVLDRAGIPADPSKVLAVVVNVTVIAPTRSGFGEAYPTGFRADNPTSLINFNQGVTVPNMAILGVGNDESITLLLQTPGFLDGDAHLVVDVFGWISKSDYADLDDTGSRLIATDVPRRGLDTRATARVGANGKVSMQVRGNAGVPDLPTVTGVLVNLTAVNTLATSTDTFVSITPERVPDGQFPDTSTTNVSRGLIKANLAIVPVGPDGRIHLYNSAGELDLLVDVFAWLESGKSDTTYEGRIIPLESPFRVWDTRQPEFGNAPLGFASQENWSLRCFAASVTVDDGPDPDAEPDLVGGQSALLGNLTGTAYNRIRPDLPGETYLALYPVPGSGGQRPNISNINVFESIDVPNMSMLTYGADDVDGDGLDPTDEYMVQAYNENGELHYIFDVYAVVLADGDAPDQTGC